MELKCVIIDDEPQGSLVLVTFADRIGNVEVLGNFDSLKDGFDYLRSINYDVDIVFLDVRLHKKLSIDYLLETGEDKLINIVFVSAYQESQFKDKGVQYFEWLEKPVRYSIYEELIEKFRNK